MKNPFIISIYIILIVFSIVGNLDARTLKIGSMSPLTGPYEINGSDIKNGALIAISDIIESGGISGFDRIKLFPQDTACNPGSAVLAANILINLKVVGVIGAYCSSSTIPASEVLKEYDIVMITPASTNEKVTSRGLPYMFRLANNSDPKKVAEVTLKHIKKRFNARSAFLINSNENYSRNLKSEIINLGDSYSIRLDEIEIQKNSNGSHRLVQMARGFNPDVICLTRMSLRNASLIISNLKRNLDNTKIIVSDLYWDTDLDTSRFRSPYEAMEGVFYVGPPDRKNSIKGKRFRDLYLNNYGKKPGIYAYQAYDATMALLKAIRNARSTDPRRIRQQILGLNYYGVSRRIAFDTNGDTKYGYCLYKIENGRAKIESCEDDEKQCCDYCIPREDSCEDDCEDDG